MSEFAGGHFGWIDLPKREPPCIYKASQLPAKSRGAVDESLAAFFEDEARYSFTALREGERVLHDERRLAHARRSQQQSTRAPVQSPAQQCIQLIQTARHAFGGNPATVFRRYEAREYHQASPLDCEIVQPIVKFCPPHFDDAQLPPGCAIRLVETYQFNDPVGNALDLNVGIMCQLIIQ